TGTGLQVDWGTILAGPALTIIFFTVLGLLAFDRSTFRKADGHESWLTFVRLGGIGRLAATALPLVASLGLAISSALSGGLSAAANEAVKTALAPAAAAVAPSPTPSPSQLPPR